MKKEEPLVDFNDIETVKKLLGQGLNPASPGNPEAVGENHTSGQATPIEWDEDVEPPEEYWDALERLLEKDTQGFIFGKPEAILGSGILVEPIPSDSQGTQIRPGPVEEEREWKRTKLGSAEDF